MEKMNLGNGDYIWFKEIYLPSKSIILWKYVQVSNLTGEAVWEGNGPHDNRTLSTFGMKEINYVGEWLDS